jgi:hypothetical protein
VAETIAPTDCKMIFAVLSWSNWNWTVKLKPGDEFTHKSWVYVVTDMKPCRDTFANLLRPIASLTAFVDFP